MRIFVVILAAAITACGSEPATPPAEMDESFYWVVMADTHVLDARWDGVEGSDYDTETLRHSNNRFERARDKVNQLDLPIDFVAIVGDLVHEHTLEDADAYYRPENRPSIDIAKEVLDGFEMPVRIGLGNHDYASDLEGQPGPAREFTSALYEQKLDVKPYYAFDHKGWRFIHVNSQLGDTWDKNSPKFNPGSGSLGREQLAWLDRQLDGAPPTFIFVHHHLAARELSEYPAEALSGLEAVIERHGDTVRHVVSGHLHRWVDLGREIVIGATRHDEDAFFVIRSDKNGEHEIMNFDAAHWVGRHEDQFLGTIDTWEPESTP